MVYLAEGAEKQIIPVMVSIDGDRLKFELSPHETHDRAEAQSEWSSAQTVSCAPLQAYCRIADRENWESEKLWKLGESFWNNNHTISLPHSDRVPAAYTYFGQFIAHDLSNLGTLDTTTGVADVRTPAFDLDSLFSAPNDERRDEQVWCGGVGIGRVQQGGEAGAFEDLPRNTCGQALIADERNDHNLALAQVHVAISKFHQIVKSEIAGEDDSHAQRITRQHIQSIALHDFLERVIDYGTYRDVLRNGRRLISPDPVSIETPFVVPIEFAAACFRVGHSMVRDTYKKWNPDSGDASAWNLLKQTKRGGGILRSGRLESVWPMSWDTMLWTENTSPADRNNASRIDQFLPTDLLELPEFSLSEFVKNHFDARHGISLATLTMLRSEFYELTSAQNLIEAIRLARPSDFPILKGDEIRYAAGLGSELEETIHLHEFHSRTPLWLYCLLESRALRDGERFGPVTSRVVMETIHAAIEAAPDSIIQSGRHIDFRVEERLGGGTRYSLHRLIDRVKSWDPQSFS